MLQAQLRCLTPPDLVSGERRQVATTVRVKCTVTDRGRIVNLKQVQSCNPLRLRFFHNPICVHLYKLPSQANYKPLRLSGRARRIPPGDSTSFMGPVFCGTASIVGPDLTAPPQTGVFCTKHFADMRLAEATPW